SELFEAKRNVSATPETTSGDWESYGLINNKDLENDQNLAALF
ncbi:MAG: hypothetical protein ACI892_002425, partial [Marinobacter maritimus]